MDLIEGLNRPFSIMDFGMAKVGKTTMAGTIFESEHIDPKKVVYLDNHGSTASLVPVPHKYTEKEPWGVFKSGDPEVMVRKMEAIIKSGEYEGLVFDDLSEGTLADMDKRNTLKGGDKARMRNWGDHLDAYSHVLRKLYPEDSGMYSIVIARAAWMANPLKKPDPDKPMDREGMQFQPMFKGQLGAFIPYSYDIITYHSLEVVGGDIASKMHFWPEGDTVVANRWLKAWRDNKISKTLTDPSFDKVYDLIGKVFA